MRVFFPLVGAITSYIGIYYAGPPRSFDEWNPLSVFLWLVFLAFFVRLLASLFGIDPQQEGGERERS